MNQQHVSSSMRIKGLMLLTVLLLSMMSIGCSSKVNDDAPQADWVLTNGQIYTVNSDTPWAEAIAIRGDKFVFVGDDAGARDFVSEGTNITDLGGRMVFPGIVDGHTHPGLIGIEQYNATFEATEHDAFIAELEAYAEANAGDGWIRGCCWPVIAYVDGDKGPDRKFLDAIFPDRPVWITSSSWHSYWLNTKAMEALGIDQDSEDPRFPIAMYKREDGGRLTGWVKEGAGWQFFADVFEVHVDIHQESVREFLQTLSEHGVTTVYDGGNLDFSDQVYGFLSQLEKAG